MAEENEAENKQSNLSKKEKEIELEEEITQSQTLQKHTAELLLLHRHQQTEQTDLQQKLQRPLSWRKGTSELSELDIRSASPASPVSCTATPRSRSSSSSRNIQLSAEFESHDNQFLHHHRLLLPHHHYHHRSQTQTQNQINPTQTLHQQFFNNSLIRGTESCSSSSSSTSGSSAAMAPPILMQYRRSSGLGFPGSGLGFSDLHSHSQQQLQTPASAPDPSITMFPSPPPPDPPLTAGSAAAVTFGLPHSIAAVVDPSSSSSSDHELLGSVPEDDAVSSRSGFDAGIPAQSPAGVPGGAPQDMASSDRAEPSASTDQKPAKRKRQKRVREARVALVTKSEVEHLEDGYRWRKYGQKAVKNSPHPRSYYRCTHSKCYVKKRVERCCEDPSLVITTYEGHHTHHSPAVLRGALLLQQQNDPLFLADIDHLSPLLNTAGSSSNIGYNPLINLSIINPSSWPASNNNNRENVQNPNPNPNAGNSSIRSLLSEHIHKPIYSTSSPASTDTRSLLQHISTNPAANYNINPLIRFNPQYDALFDMQQQQQQSSTVISNPANPSRSAINQPYLNQQSLNQPTNHQQQSLNQHCQQQINTNPDHLHHLHHHHHHQHQSGFNIGHHLTSPYGSGTSSASASSAQYGPVDKGLLDDMLPSSSR